MMQCISLHKMFTLVFFFLSAQLNQKDLEAELGEAGHHSRCNSLHSDLSWEQVNEEDAKRTLWVPDHAVSQCPMCNIQFGLLYRRHHCRYVEFHSMGPRPYRLPVPHIQFDLLYRRHHCRYMEFSGKLKQNNFPSPPPLFFLTVHLGWG